VRGVSIADHHRRSSSSRAKMTVVDAVSTDAAGAAPAAAAAPVVVAQPGNGQTVCVTGAAGYIASWLVKMLLEKGYTVKGTVRNPDDPKNAHLKALDGAAERLILCKADLLDYDAICRAVQGCQGVFHTASPVTDDPVSTMLTTRPIDTYDHRSVTSPRLA